MEIGAGELALDELPDPLHRRSERNMRRTVPPGARSTREQSNKSAEWVDDGSSRITTPGERDSIITIVVGEDRYFERIYMPYNVVHATMRHESGQGTNGSVLGESAFDDMAPNAFSPFDILAIGASDVRSGKDALDRMGPFLKFGWQAGAIMHQASELRGRGLWPWKYMRNLQRNGSARTEVVSVGSPELLAELYNAEVSRVAVWRGTDTHGRRPDNVTNTAVLRPVPPRLYSHKEKRVLHWRHTEIRDLISIRSHMRQRTRHKLRLTSSLKSSHSFNS